MIINVKGAKGNKRLCDSCDRSHIIKGPKESDELIWCTANGFDSPTVINIEVHECNKYRAKNMPSLYEMEKMALIITQDKKGKIGFVRWSKYQEEHPHEAGLPTLPGLES